MGGGNPRQMQQMMRKLGIDMAELDDVQEIVIKTPTRDYIFDNATVSIMRAQGTETYTINGTPRIEEHAVTIAISEEDVQMAMEQTGKTEEEVRASLDETGDLAETIIALMDD